MITTPRAPANISTKTKSKNNNNCACNGGKKKVNHSIENNSSSNSNNNIHINTYTNHPHHPPMHTPTNQQNENCSLLRSLGFAFVSSSQLNSYSYISNCNSDVCAMHGVLDLMETPSSPISQASRPAAPSPRLWRHLPGSAIALEPRKQHPGRLDVVCE